MHDFLKFVFYLGVAFQFFYCLFTLFFPSTIVTGLAKGTAFSDRVKELQDKGEEPNEDPELKSKVLKTGCFGVFLVALLTHFYLTLVLGLFTLNWYVFLAYLIYCIIRVGIGKVFKRKVSITTTIIGSLIGLLVFGFTLINAYQLHITFSDLFR